MPKYCAICCVYEEPSAFITLSCGCTFCKNSISQWVLTQIEKYYQADFQITCPLGTLGHTMSENDIRNCLAEYDYQVYANFLLKRELIRDSSFKQCPSKNCDYVGWVDTKNSCMDTLLCPKCKTKWKDPSLKPAFYRLKDDAIRIIRGESDFWSNTWKEIWVKYCPKCDYPIEKSGGCYHMTCINCRHEFCWDCLQDYKNHIWKYCGLNMLYCWGFMVILTVLFLCKITILSDTILDLLWFIFWKILLFTAGVIGIWAILGSIGLAVIYLDKKQWRVYTCCEKFSYFIFNCGIFVYFFCGVVFLQDFTIEVFFLALNFGISFLFIVPTIILLYQRI
ncbi:unnamed protein product [Blepharisma stoltei]|uniref:RBR-type E3 ubiquitin transferase n=1 Tax=Blepharisma stoltei TaxID=1481888 RepID=A0AAU9IU40_9CILI|nr:unnamed protein product [Blepharisma stoltei]